MIVNIRAGQPLVFNSSDDEYEVTVGAGDVVVMASHGTHLSLLEIPPGTWQLRCRYSRGQAFPVVSLVLPSICARLLAHLPTSAEDIFSVFEEAGLLPASKPPVHH